MQFSRDEHPELPAILGFTRGTVFWPISKLPKGIIPGHRNGCFDGSYGPGLPSHNADLRVSMGLSRVKKKRFSWHWGYCTTIWWLSLGENDDDDALDLGISLMLGQTHRFFPLGKTEIRDIHQLLQVDFMIQCFEGKSLQIHWDFHSWYGKMQRRAEHAILISRSTNHMATVVPTKTATASLTSLKYLDMSQAMLSKPIRIPMFHRPSGTCKWGPTSCARSQLCNSTRSKALMLP